MMLSSIKTKVALTAAASMLAVLGLAFGIQVYMVRAEMTRVLEAQQLSLVTRVADDIDDRIGVRLGALERLARVTRVGVPGDEARLQAEIAGRNSIYVLFDVIAVVGVDGTQLARVPALAQPARLNVADRPWFRQAIAADAPRVSEPLRSLISGNPVVILSAPIRGPDGKIVALLTGSLDLFKPNFLGSIGAAKVGNTGSFTLFARDRTIIMSPDAGRLLQPGPAPGVSPHFDAALAGTQGTLINRGNGTLHGLVSYIGLNTVPWVLAAALPIDEAFGPLKQAENNIVLAMVLVALVAVPLVWLAMRRLLAPLGHLHEAVRAHRQDPAAPLAVLDHPSDEIGGLAADFQALAEERAQADAQMRQRKHELEDSNRDLDAFCHTVAHDMRAPLRHIAGYATELRHVAGQQLDAEAAGLLEKVITAANLQSEMIEGLLEYAGLQQQNPTLRPVELAPLLHSLIEEAKAGREVKPGTVWKIGSLPAVRGDDVLLRHLFANLIDNAVKYSSKREQPVIDIGWTGQGATLARIHVTDNGDGFEMRYADKLFGMFQRLHSVREFPGTGIGLALVRRIAERLDGSVEAQGEVGKGATFSVVLHLA